MGRKRVMVAIGTRPEAIKLAPIVLALRRQPGLLPVVVTTGQHTEAVREVLDIFGIAADEDLAVGEAGFGLAAIAAAVLTRFAALMRSGPPDAVLVQGDTTSALGAALAAFYQQIPVAHVEAGLRSGNRYAPFPEEIHRRMTSLACDLHFAPTGPGMSGTPSAGALARVTITAGHPHHLSGRLEEVTARTAFTEDDKAFVESRRTGGAVGCFL